MQDYVPHGDQALAEWTRVMAQAVSASPGSYGLSAAQAAEYDAAQQAYAEALAVASRPQTRTAPAVSHKNAERKALIALSRRVAGIIQAHPGTTDETRTRLGLTIRKKRVKMAAVTIERPTVRVLSAEGSRLMLRVGKREGVGRARPEGARGYTWFYFVGERYPESLGRWSFGGNGIDPTVEVVLKGVEPGAKVWFVANWFNSRMQPGPMSDPIITRVAGGLVGVEPGTSVSAQPDVGVVNADTPLRGSAADDDAPRRAA